MKPTFAEVLFPKKLGPDRQTLTYELPPELLENPGLKEGDIVDVPIRNRIERGVIYNIHQNKPTYKCRLIVQKTANAPHLATWQMELMKWIGEYYFTPLNKALRLFLPTNILKKKKIKDFIKLPSDTPYELKFRHKLSSEQIDVIEKLDKTDKKVALLHGITGSGKTEIYMHIVEKVLKQGKQVLILIPEISLTPQTCQRFSDFFHEPTVAIHSQLSVSQKEKAWLSIHNGESKIIIGSRSALFAPFQNLGYIIMDEEHDSCYKQDQSPRYHALRVAEKMTELLGIKLLTGSATPTIPSYHKATKGEYELLTLSLRPNKKNSGLPTAKIIDLREEIKAKNFSIFSETLQYEIMARLAKKEQIILFLNRRGAASAVVCRVCGYEATCPNCDIPMTYHKRINVENNIYSAERLICHHCGFIGKVPIICPNCDSAYIKYIGLGTQKIEEDASKLFPGAKILRADRDTTQHHRDFEKIYQDFRDGKADILIGTQMIALGLHLPKVSLVGIILADMGLLIPNFDSAERTFQIITQVSGRAGREDKPGNVIIQTYMPDHYAIMDAATSDYQKFFEAELNIRKNQQQPPFTKLIKITIKDHNATKCHSKTEQIYNHLNKIALTASKDPDKPEFTIFHYPALIPRLNNYHRWHILISGDNPSKLLKQLPSLEGLLIDVDPISTV